MLGISTSAGLLASLLMLAMWMDHTRVGQLNFFDGATDIDSAQKVYKLLDFTHAYQTFLDGTNYARSEVPCSCDEK